MLSTHDIFPCSFASTQAGASTCSTCDSGSYAKSGGLDWPFLLSHGLHLAQPLLDSYNWLTVGCKMRLCERWFHSYRPLCLVTLAMRCTLIESVQQPGFANKCKWFMRHRFWAWAGHPHWKATNRAWRAKPWKGALKIWVEFITRPWGSKDLSEGFATSKMDSSCIRKSGSGRRSRPDKLWSCTIPRRESGGRLRLGIPNSNTIYDTTNVASVWAHNFGLGGRTCQTRVTDPTRGPEFHFSLKVFRRHCVSSVRSTVSYWMTIIAFRCCLNLMYTLELGSNQKESIIKWSVHMYIVFKSWEAWIHAGASSCTQCYGTYSGSNGFAYILRLFVRFLMDQVIL
jgi:hypothetical protein